MDHQGNMQMISGAAMAQRAIPHQPKIGLKQFVSPFGTAIRAQVQSMYIAIALGEMQALFLLEQAHFEVIGMGAGHVRHNQVVVKNDKRAHAQAEQWMCGRILFLHILGFGISRSEVENGIQAKAGDGHQNELQVDAFGLLNRLFLLNHMPDDPSQVEIEGHHRGDGRNGDAEIGIPLGQFVEGDRSAEEQEKWQHQARHEFEWPKQNRDEDRGTALLFLGGHGSGFQAVDRT